MLGLTFAQYISMRFLRMILGVFATVFALIYTIDFIELMRRAGDAPGATARSPPAASRNPRCRRN